MNNIIFVILGVQVLIAILSATLYESWKTTNYSTLGKRKRKSIYQICSVVCYRVPPHVRIARVLWDDSFVYLVCAFLFFNVL
jgi:hypothetical protein